MICISESHRCVVKFLNRECPYEPTQKKILKHETEECMEMTVSGTKNELMRKTSFANDVQWQYEQKELSRKLEVQSYARLGKKV